MATAFLFSCQKEDNLDNVQIDDFESIDVLSDKTILGKQLENPYSVENMKRALYELKSSNTLKSSSLDEDFEIETTHLYVRFLPKNEEELDLLKQDTLLHFYDYPLDYEITSPGIYYHDPTLPDTVITWQYTVVSPDYNFTTIEYEILSELFLIEEKDADSNLKSATVNIPFWDMLEDKALEITRNLDETNISGAVLKSSKWRPAGRIRAWDDVLNKYVPIVGVEVKARRWFTTHKGTTNTNGNFSCDGKFKRDANYSFSWERYHFSIRSGTVGQANYNGPKKTGDWNLDIKGNKSQFYATIYRATNHYYYGNRLGLRRPPENGLLKPQMKIAAMYKTNNDRNGRHAASLRVLGIFNWIKIWNPENKCNQIYGTTIHELAHASHWDMGSNDYNNTSLIVKESWARGVQWALTRLEYPTYSISYSRLDYTGIVQDLIDGNKTTSSSYHSKYAIDSVKNYSDQVNGYTIRQIEDALKGKRNWDDWKTNIKSKYSNGTKDNVDAAFNYWNSK